MLARAILLSLTLFAVSHAYIVKRSLPPKDRDTKPLHHKRFIFPTISAQVQPTIANQQYCYYGLPGLKPAYLITEDGFIYYLINGQLVLAQGITTTGTTGQVSTTGTVSTSGGGGLLSFLGKPLDAVGDIISKTHEVASGVVNLPFEAGRQVISGVGLDDTLIGDVATGIIDIGEGIEQTKLGLLAGAAELPFRLAADVAYAVDE